MNQDCNKVPRKAISLLLKPVRPICPGDAINGLFTNQASQRTTINRIVHAQNVICETKGHCDTLNFPIITFNS